MATMTCSRPCGVGRAAGACRRPRTGVIARATQEATTGIVFRPFQEVKGELATVSDASGSLSFARVGYAEECEAALNEQINIEYTISYVYHALHAYFDRDNVGLPGFAAFFKAASEEERGHAQLLITYQNKRGGRVKLQVGPYRPCRCGVVVINVIGWRQRHRLFSSATSPLVTIAADLARTLR
jgi:Ferritin-like domain